MTLAEILELFMRLVTSHVSSSLPLYSRSLGQNHSGGSARNLFVTSFPVYYDVKNVYFYVLILYFNPLFLCIQGLWVGISVITLAEVQELFFPVFFLCSNPLFLLYFRSMGWYKCDHTGGSPRTLYGHLQIHLHQARTLQPGQEVLQGPRKPADL